MLEQRTALKNKKSRTTLYRVVFESSFVKGAVFGLFAFLLVQPVSLAFAAEDIAEVQAENIETIEPIIVDSGIEEAEDVIDTGSDSLIADVEVAVEQDEEASTPSQSEVLEATTTEDTLDIHDVVIPDVAGFEPSTSTASTSGQVEGSVDDVDTTEASSTSETASTTGEVIVPVEEIPVVEATTTDPVVILPAIEEVIEATSTEATTTTEEVLVAVHNSSAYEFNTDECAIVGNGAYYCSDPEKSQDQFNDGVFAAPDSDGDLEIYVRVNGEERAVTSNTVDDSAPSYDSISERIVWHSMIDDRYQIVSYDTKTDKQTYLTNTLYNNMEPMAYGNITLWQAWIDSNWEIMMYDGEKILQLTNNTMQDVSPHMREGYIVWQTQFTEGWQVAVYDQETKTVEYIPSEGGLKVENPRFVLVYDSTDDNGDTQTLGFDLNTKTSFMLGNLPAELPDELPEPDQTGETRALIQNKQTSKEGENEVIDVPQIGSNNQTGSTSTSTNEIGTLDLSQGTTTVVASSTTVTDVVDIVVPSYSATSTENPEISDIPDIVIPPVVSTSTEEVS